MQSNTVTLYKELIKSYSKQFIIIVFLTLVDAALLAFSVISIIPLADFFIDSTLSSPSKITLYCINLLRIFELTPGLYSFVTIFIFLNFLKSIFTVLINFTIYKTKYFIVQNLTQKLLTAIFTSKWSFFSNLGPGKLFNTIRNELPKVGDAVGFTCILIASSIQLICYFLVPIYLNPKLTLIVILGSLIVFIPYKLLKNLSKNYGKLSTETANNYASTINESLLGAKFFLSSGYNNFIIKKNISALIKHIKPTINFFMIQLSLDQLLKPLIVLIVISSIIIVNNDKENLSEYAAIFWSLMAIAPLFGKILNNYLSLVNVMPSYVQMRFFIDKASKHKENQGNLKFEDFNKYIEFKDVDFSYSKKDILNKCNFKIFKNKVNIIKGESGKGKSTIIDLLIGLQEPKKGEVLLDGIHLNRFNLKKFREKISVINQEPFLFYDSVLNNITLFKDNIDEEELNKALNFSESLKFINNLPNGLNTIIGDRGSQLSGGQKQRLILARAYLRKPTIMILDEATNSLDKDTQEKVIDNLRAISKKITIILITHEKIIEKKEDNIITFN